MRTIYVDKHIPRVLLTKAITPFWKDFVWTSLSVARAGSLDDLPLPGPHWIRVKNLACGICATDLSLLFVKANPSVAPAALPGVQRFYLGHEVVSVVTEVGPAVTRFRVGDRVIMDKHFYGANCLNLELEQPCEMCLQGETSFCLHKSDYPYLGVGGGFGDEYITHETGVQLCPSELTLDQAVLVEPIGIGTHAVLRHAPKPGARVLVIGAGMIGLSVLMAVRAAQPDCEVTVLSRYDFQSQMAERLGAKNILYQRDGYRDIAKASGGKFFSAPLNKGIVVGGFDIIYDCVGNSDTLNDCLRWVKAMGKVVLVGSHLMPMTNLDLVPIWYHQVELVGVVGHGIEHFAGEEKHTYDWVFEFMKRGLYSTDGFITHRFPYEEYKQAIAVADGHKGAPKAIKVVMQT
ncbi:MAG TPA: alcohol dehydrogenase catalytic domain-containing protein [Anaerolineales bacterium]|nr:alcohol dehydrogenase catalytic domain-containing protein [Anaerolineales bacterium]